MTDFSLDDLDAMLGKEGDAFGSLFKGSKAPTRTSAAGQSLNPQPAAVSSPATSVNIPGMPGGSIMGRARSPAQSTVPTPSFVSAAEAPTSPARIVDSGLPPGNTRPATGGLGRPGSSRRSTAPMSSAASVASGLGELAVEEAPMTPATDAPPPRPASVISGYSIGTGTSRQAAVAKARPTGKPSRRRTTGPNKDEPSWFSEISEQPATATDYGGGATSRATSEVDFAALAEEEEDPAEGYQDDVLQTANTNAATGTGSVDDDPLSFLERSGQHGLGTSRAVSPVPTSGQGRGGNHQSGPSTGKSLAQMELELHGQLAAVSEELKTQEYLHNARVEADEQARRDLENRMTKLEDDLEKEKLTLAKQTAESEQKLKDKKDSFTEMAQVEVAALRAKHGEVERIRKSKQVNEIQEEMKAADASVSEVLTIRELLSRGVSKSKAIELAKIAKEQWRADSSKFDSTAPPTFDIDDETVVNEAVKNYVLSKEGIAVIVEDASDLTAKVNIVADQVRQFLLRARDGITTKLKSIISEELRNVVNERYASRSLERQSERVERREQVLDHQRGNSERFRDFVAKRQGHREEEKRKLLDKAKEEHDDFVAKTSRRLEEQKEAFDLLIADQKQELLALNKRDLDFQTQKHRVLLNDDQKIFSMELQDLRKRQSYGETSRRGLLTEEADSLRLALDLEAKAGLGQLDSTFVDSSSGEVVRIPVGSSLMTSVQGLFRSPFESSRTLKSTLKEMNDQVAERQRVLRLDTFERASSPMDGGVSGSATAATAELKHQVHQLKEQLAKDQDALYSAQLNVQASLTKTEAMAGRLVESTHDSLLGVRAQLTEVERTKLLWEKELRMMLSETATSDGLNGGASPNRLDRSGRVLPAVTGSTRRTLFAQEDAINDMLSSLSGVLRSFTQDCKKRSQVLHSNTVRQEAAEEQFVKSHDEAERSISELFHAILRIPKVMDETKDREEKIWMEKARVEAEKTVLQREEEAFEFERERIETLADSLRNSSEDVMMSHDQVNQAKRQQEEKMAALEEEHQILLNKQSAVQKELRQIHREHQRIDGVMSRLAHAESTRFLFHGPTKSSRTRHVRFDYGADVSASGNGGKETTSGRTGTGSYYDYSSYSYGNYTTATEPSLLSILNSTSNSTTPGGAGGVDASHHYMADTSRR